MVKEREMGTGREEKEGGRGKNRKTHVGWYEEKEEGERKGSTDVRKKE